MNNEFFEPYLGELSQHLRRVDFKQLASVGDLMISAHRSGKKVIIAGNGGSSAMAAHVAVDLTKNSGVRAVTFNETDLITCFANDFGYEHWIAKSLEYYADPGDLVVLVSSSGKSPNIIQAAQTAKKRGLKLVTFSGFAADNPLRSLGDFNFWIDCKQYNLVEMTHHSWLLAIVDYIAAKNT